MITRSGGEAASRKNSVPISGMENESRTIRLLFLTVLYFLLYLSTSILYAVRRYLPVLAKAFFANVLRVILVTTIAVVAIKVAWIIVVHA
jgi:hypothetical protein